MTIMKSVPKSFSNAELAKHFLRDAKVFFQSATKLEPYVDFAPKHFLYSHSIELALKAIILSRKPQVRQKQLLQIDLGHDLKKALKLATECGLPSKVELKTVVLKYAEYHGDASYRYHNSSLMFAPPEETSNEMIRWLLDAAAEIVAMKA